MAALQSGPAKITQKLEKQASNINMPRIGFEGNPAFSTVQVNVASTKEASEQAGAQCLGLQCALRDTHKSSLASQFEEDLGPLAAMHIDPNDSPGGYTCMITLSHVALEDDPGWFMLAELGVAISTT